MKPKTYTRDGWRRRVTRCMKVNINLEAACEDVEGVCVCVCVCVEKESEDSVA